MIPSAVYISGKIPENPGPLARYQPPVPVGVIQLWLRSKVPSGEFVLDPFGSSPRTALEAAQSGYRVIVAANNPVARFLLEITALHASEAQLRATLADLAAMRKGDERIEPHIRSLYATRCHSCGQEIEAISFLWERGSMAPYGKIYSCPYCGDSDQRPADEDDIERATQFNADKLHHARALERVTSLDDPDRPHAEEALATYLPRAVYALFTIINKLDGMRVPPLQRKLLEGLVLSACDQANCLWAYPGTRSRPKSLSIPPRFRESNIWFSLENAIKEWIPAGDAQLEPVPVSYWPDLPPESGGITIFEGRLKELVDSLSATEIHSVIGAIPRPNQAFWTLSALWAGWLWGREAVRPFKSVLRRRRYDWTWHSIALHAALENLSKVLSPGDPFFALIGEVESGFISSFFTAASIAGFSLEGLALREEGGFAQTYWAKAPSNKPAARFTPQEFVSRASRAALNFLEQRGEPASYLQIHTASFASLVAGNYLIQADDPSTSNLTPPGEMLSQITSSLEQAFNYRSGFLRYSGSDKSMEVGQWWLRADIAEQSENSTPLSDRVEMELVRYLLKLPASSMLEIDQALCNAYPGLHTPNEGLIATCLNSYAIQEQAGSDRWKLRPEEYPGARRNDLSAIRNALLSLANKLDFRCDGDRPLLWLDAEGRTHYVFYILASATFGEIVSTSPYKPSECILILPGSRANLALYKLKHNGYLSQKISLGWRLVKFRHVHRLLEIATLNRQNFDDNLALDPLQDTAHQIRLL